MKIAYIVDKKGRIQDLRANVLREYLVDSGHEVGIYTIKDKPDFSKYDRVYYSHFSLYHNLPTKKQCITSVTSHKCLQNIKQTINQLSNFDGFSVNNTFLYTIFSKSFSNVFYTPNGVDTNKFLFNEKERESPLRLGWVGNKDREVKNYHTILSHLLKDYNFKIVATSKSDKEADLLSHGKMAKYYKSIDVYLVTSSNEGTPNPALEALSTGVPVITTHVGNMVEIIEDGYNGFFSEANVESFKASIKKMSDMGADEYKSMRKAARASVDNWDWSSKFKDWIKFLTFEF